MHTGTLRGRSRGRVHVSRPATLLLAVVLALLLFMLLAPRSAGAHARTRVIARFGAGTQFPESLATLPGGRLAVSVTDWGPTASSPNTGRVLRIDRRGHRRALSPTLHLGGGLLTGVAVDRHGVVYVAHATYDGVTTPGILRVAHGKARRIAALPIGSFPNGLAFHDGALYVSDSTLGEIWRIVRGHAPVVVAASQLLAPSTADGLGANGIAFHRGALDVAVSEAGRIVRFPWWRGRPAKPFVLASSAQLAGADGILVGRGDALYVTSNDNDSIARVSASGHHVRTVSTAGDGLLYPTALAWSGAPDRSSLFVLNGDFLAKGTPTLVELVR
jgi:hypothetical protein